MTTIRSLIASSAITSSTTMSDSRTGCRLYGSDYRVGTRVFWRLPSEYSSSLRPVHATADVPRRVDEFSLGSECARDEEQGYCSSHRESGLTLPPFSGERERERSNRPVPPTATAGWTASHE